MKSRILRIVPLCAILCLLAGTSAWAAAGKTIFASGEAQAQDPQNVSRALRRGDAVNSGDTLITGAGKLQVRFSDGGLISLQEHTRFVVDDYNFEESGDKASFSLLKGGLRAVTGTIGVRSKETYSVTTPVATIGIRGTGFTLRYCAGDCPPVNGKPQPDGLYVSTQDGTIYIANPAGIIDLAVGQSAFVASRETPPELIDTPPLLLPPADETSREPTFLAGEQNPSEDGIPGTLFTPRSVFDNLAAQNLVGIYSGVGGSATDQFGNQGQITSASLYVYFGSATLAGGADIIFPDNQTSDASFSFSGSFISGTTLFTGTGDGSTTQADWLSISGGLLGANAEGALMNFAYDNGDNSVSSGTITFEQTGLTLP